MDVFVDFFNWILDGCAEGIIWLVEFLPKSPTQSFSNEKPEMVTLSYISWFIPFPTLLLHFTAILTAIGVYYIYRIIGRWLKVVRG